ncbi:MAG: hypothetical protein WCG55_04670 [bacterium]
MQKDGLNPVKEKFYEILRLALVGIEISEETFKKIEQSTTCVKELTAVIQMVVNRYGPEAFQLGVLFSQKTSDGLNQYCIDTILKKSNGEERNFYFENTFLCDKYAKMKIDVSPDCNHPRKVEEYVLTENMNDMQLEKNVEFPTLTILDYLFYYIILVAMPELGKKYLGYELKKDGTIYLIQVTDESNMTMKVSHRVKDNAWYSDAYHVNGMSYPKNSVVIYFVESK